MTFKERILEEANQSVADSVAKVHGGDIVGGLPIFGLPGMAAHTIGDVYAGYTVGKELDHPVAGTLFGAEGAAGAKSQADPEAGITIGDVYSKENIAKRAIQLGVPSAVLGAMLSGGILGTLDGTAEVSALAGGALGAAAGGTLRPGISYGLGKTSRFLHDKLK